MGFSIATIERRCKEKHGVLFVDYYRTKSAAGKMSLRRKQFEVALKGSIPMLIFLGKNLLGQSDSRNSDTGDEPGIKSLADAVKSSRKRHGLG